MTKNRSTASSARPWRRPGYGVSRAETGAEALREAAAHPPSLVLLDLGLPDMDGLTVLRRLRATASMPVIVLSARDRPAEKIAALDAGANDYVEKPFDMGELMARVRAALRGALAAQSTQTLFVFGTLEVDLDRRQVRADGAAVSLTPREYDLLVLLVRHAGRVITHKQLLTAVWGPAHSFDVQYLRVYVGTPPPEARNAGGGDAGDRARRRLPSPRVRSVTNSRLMRHLSII